MFYRFKVDLAIRMTSFRNQGRLWALGSVSRLIPELLIDCHVAFLTNTMNISTVNQTCARLDLENSIWSTDPHLLYFPYFRKETADILAFFDLFDYNNVLDSLISLLKKYLNEVKIGVSDQGIFTTHPPWFSLFPSDDPSRLLCFCFILCLQTCSSRDNRKSGM